MTDQIQRMKVLGAGIFSLILALGVARFSYTPLLPLMQQQAGLGLAEGGWLAAINYGGYLTGALVAASISDLVLKDRLFRIGMVVAVLTTLMMGLTTDFWVWDRWKHQDELVRRYDGAGLVTLQTVLVSGRSLLVRVPAVALDVAVFGAGAGAACVALAGDR